MRIHREQLEAQFRDLSDEELLERCRTDLTELAREITLAEATQRGLALAVRAAFDAGEYAIDEDFDVNQ